MHVYEAEGFRGTVELIPGAGNKAVLAFRRTDVGDRRVGTNLVVTIRDHLIISMTEYRRQSKARRLSNVT